MKAFDKFCHRLATCAEPGIAASNYPKRSSLGKRSPAKKCQHHAGRIHLTSPSANTRTKKEQIARNNSQATALTVDESPLGAHLRLKESMDGLDLVARAEPARGKENSDGGQR
jgi:hypothetical protein